MKKVLYITSIFALSSVLLSGCIRKNNPAQTGSADQTQDQVISEWKKIADAIALGKSASCDMTNTQTGEVSNYYIKGKSIRFDTVNKTDQTKSGSFLTDEKYVYTWNDANKQGVKFAVVDHNEQPQAAPQTETPDFSTQESWDNYKDMGYTVDCSVSAVDDSLFIPPSDVTFVDMSQLNQQLINQPVGSGDPAVIDEEQLKKLMEQYSGTEE